MPSVFLLGATGYIGGGVLIQLHEAHPDWPIAILARNPDRAAAVRPLAASCVIGTVDDTLLVEEQASKADIVVNTVDADNLPLTQAILRGLKRRWESSGRRGILVHTSGMALFGNDEREGKADPTGKIWNDMNEDDIRAIPTSAFHGNVDVPILQSGKEGYVDAYIIAPAVLLGKSKAPLPTMSAFSRVLGRSYIKEQYAAYIGPGSNSIPCVLMDDLADLYLRVIDLAVSGKDKGASPYTRYFMGSATNVPFLDIATTFGTVMHRHGLLPDPAPVSVELSKVSDRNLLFYFGCDVRVAPKRASTTLGWNPKPALLTIENVETSFDFAKFAPERGAESAIGT